MASPPKPWEQGGSASQTTGTSQPLTSDSGAIGSTIGPATASQAANAATGLYSNTGSAYGGSSYGSSAGGYGATGMNMMNSPYGGASSMYGGGYGMNSMYGTGGMGGYGSYGSGYGGYGGYGGGYGSAYGGYGGMGYGGYGSSYGGYGGYGSRYGMGGMGMGMGGMGMSPEMGWLGGLHQTIGSMGQISELLGMNAEAMQFAFGAFGNFLERIGGVAQEVFSFFMGTPPPMQIDPRTGQPIRHMIDPRNGQPIIDPRTGQPVMIPTPEEFKEQRKRRFIRWIIGVFVVYMGYRFIRALFRSRQRQSISANPGLNAAFMEVAARQGNQNFMANGPGFGLGNDMAYGPASMTQSYPAFRGGGLSDSFEAAFNNRKTVI